MDKAKPKATVVAKKQVKSKAKVSKAKKSTRVVKKQTKSVSTRSNRSLATPKTISKYNSLEKNPILILPWVKVVLFER
mgnify:FL=1